MSNPREPAPLRPRDGRLFVVRWIRDDGHETRHRHFRRQHDAGVLLEKLLEDGHEAAMFVSDTEWAKVALS